MNVTIQQVFAFAVQTAIKNKTADQILPAQPLWNGFFLDTEQLQTLKMTMYDLMVFGSFKLPSPDAFSGQRPDLQAAPSRIRPDL